MFNKNKNEKKVYNEKEFFAIYVLSIIIYSLIAGLVSLIGWFPLTVFFALSPATMAIQLPFIFLIRHFCSKEKAAVLERALNLTVAVLTLSLLFSLNLTFLFALQLIGTVYIAFSLANRIFSKDARDQAVKDMFGEDPRPASAPSATPGQGPTPPAPTVGAANDDLLDVTRVIRNAQASAAQNKGNDENEDEEEVITLKTGDLKNARAELLSREENEEPKRARI